MSEYRQGDNAPNFKENVGRKFELLTNADEWITGRVNGVEFPQTVDGDGRKWSFQMKNDIVIIAKDTFYWLEPPLPTASEISNPSYYGGSDNPYEAIKVINAHDLNFCLGNAIKYVLRAGKKDSETRLKDLQKAIEYLQFEIDKG